MPAATHHFPPVFAQQTSAAAQSFLPVQGLVAAVPQSAGQVVDVSPPKLLHTPSPHRTAPLHVASKSAQQLLSCLHSELHAHGMPARKRPQDPWHENALLSLRQPLAVPHANKSVAVGGVPALAQITTFVLSRTVPILVAKCAEHALGVPREPKRFFGLQHTSLPQSARSVVATILANYVHAGQTARLLDHRPRLGQALRRTIRHVGTAMRAASLSRAALRVVFPARRQDDMVGKRREDAENAQADDDIRVFNVERARRKAEAHRHIQRG